MKANFNSKDTLSETTGSKIWLKRLDNFVDKHIDDISLDNKKIANSFQISERQLFRKIKELTGLTPQKYLKYYRLEKAMVLLKKGKFRTVKETASAIGYSKSNYFSNQFKNEYGKKPLKVLQEFGWR